MTRGNEVHLHFEAKRSRRAELISRLAAVGATALREVRRTKEGDVSSTRDVALRVAGASDEQIRE